MKRGHKVLMQDSCRVGLPKIFTIAHMCLMLVLILSSRGNVNVCMVVANNIDHGS